MPDLITALKGVKVKRQTKPRKYATNDPRWRRIRLRQLTRYPLCKHCQDKGVTKAANTVDHMDGNSWNNATINLMSLCTICHTIKTNLHDGGLGRKRSTA